MIMKELSYTDNEYFSYYKLISLKLSEYIWIQLYVSDDMFAKVALVFFVDGTDLFFVTV